MTIARLIAAVALFIAAGICLIVDARACRKRAEEDTRRERAAIDDYVPFVPLPIGLGGFLAGMTCLICAAVVLS